MIAVATERDGSTRSPTESYRVSVRWETAARVATVRASREVRPSQSRVGSLRTSSPETARSRAQRSEVTLDACAVGETRCPARKHGVTVRGRNPSVHSGVRPWNGRAREGFLRGRHVRSTCRRSVRPAIHVPSRGSPRSSSTGEPSDPPFGALHSELNAAAFADRVPSFFPKLGKTRTTEGDASDFRPFARGRSFPTPRASVRPARGFMNRT